ncbi:MAG: hypothetical protein L7S63_09560 [Flavobacteriales bacterium]|nr:hypothetical protein [Flavobacteriales bacterium]
MDQNHLTTLLLLCALIIGLPNALAQEGAIENESIGVLYTDLSQAVAEANAGDVLNLSAVTFAQRLVLDKPISLIGAPAGGTVIDIRGTASWGLHLTASGITLENLTVLSDISHTAYAIHSEPNTTDIVIRDVRVLNNAASGIDLNGLVGPGTNIIEDCEVVGCAAGFGLALSSCQNVLVRDFTSSKNGYGDIGILESAYSENKSQDILFEGNMGLAGPQGDGLGGIVVQQDTTLVEPGIGAGFDIDMQAGLIHQLTGSTSYDGNPLGYLLCSTEDVAELSASLSQGLGIDDLLGKNLLSGEVEVWPGMSLQEAVNAADPEDVIRVAKPGVYDSLQITIGKSITILGPNQGLAADDPARTTEAIFMGGLVVNASNVLIDGVRLLARDGDPFGLRVAAGASNIEVKNTVIRGWFEENGDTAPIGLIHEGQAELTDCSLRNWPVAVSFQGGDLQLNHPVISDNREGVRMDANNGNSDALRIVNGELRNAGADAFAVVAADANDSLVVTAGTANLHRHAFRFDVLCLYDVNDGLYEESEEQIIGLSTAALIALCEDNDFSNPAITIDACDDPTAVNYEACATLNSGNCVYSGCTDSGACNYNADAATDDGSCEFQSCSGCINPIACNYDESATLENGSCEFVSCRGCTDQEALNFDADALYDDGSCLFPGCLNPEADNFDPDANFDNGICFFYGCTDDTACNYDPSANFNLGTCEFTSCAGCLNPRACNYDASATIDAQNCDFTSCRGCTNPDAQNYDSTATIDDGSCRVLGCTDSNASNYNPDATKEDGSCLYSGCTDAGACNYDPSASTDDGSCEFTSCAGCAIEGFCNYDPTVTVHDGTLCDYLSCCGDPAATNYDPDILPQLTFGCTYGMSANMTFFDGCTLSFACNYLSEDPCEFDSCAGCTVSTACNYDADATLSTSTCQYPIDVYGVDYLDCAGNCLNDADQDGTCDENETLGCTDNTACNFDAQATQDDSSCEFTSCAGCTDLQACNFESGSTINDGSCEYESCSGCQDQTACNYDATATQAGGCIYPADLYGSASVDCSGACLNDADEDGICDEDEVPGCTDSDACNYDALATEDNGSCDLVSCAGCMDNTACNFDATAEQPDGSCEYITCAGCTDPAGCNYVASATISTPCIFPDEDYLDCDGECLVDTDQDGVCDSQEVLGCDDIEACNYSDVATDNDGSCDYTTCAGCTNPGACNYNPSVTINDGSCNYTACQGCTDPEACNYIPGATTDDGGCIYVLDLYNVTNLTCGGDCVNDTDGDGICDEDELSGCTDSEACNYLEAADFDDGTCEFVSCGGCLDPTACNYVESAQFDDGSCTTPLSLYGKNYVDCSGACLNDADGDGICDEDETGCTDLDACNYDASASVDDGTCTYPLEDYLDCDGNCLNDDDDDGICDELEALGCTDQTACNYDANATDDDGNCTYVDGICQTCENGVIVNNDFDQDGICDDQDVCAGDFNDDGIRSASDVLVVLAAFGCIDSCGDADLDGDGNVTASDVLEMLSLFGSICPN